VRALDKEDEMSRQRSPVLLGLTLAVALALFVGAAGCTLPSVFPGAGTEPEIELWSGEEVVPPGGCTLVHWDVSGAEDYPIFFDGQEVPASGEQDVCLDETRTFELVVAAPSGSVRETVLIRVEGGGEEPPPEEAPPPEGGPEVINFIVEPDTIPKGGCAILHWEVQPPEFHTIVNGEDVEPIGEREECPEGTVTFELVVEAPGGPQTRSVTLHVEEGAAPEPPAATATKPPSAPAPTATQPPSAPAPTATQPPPAPPAATATPTTFVPVWGQCSWVGVEQAGINSHQPKTWCPNGSFLTGLDLDRQGSYDPLDSPVVGQAQCCPLSVAQYSPWGQCSWVKVEQAGINSHQPVAYCPNGQYLTGLDLDRIATDPMDSPGIGEGFCCPLGDPKYSGWGSCSWVGVEQAGINSHQPVTWCPNGSFLVGLDLDRIATDAMDSPGVGQAYCCTPNR
jgi:hypothetical protein